eukprot:6485670-Amphidinium_carterae.1
MLWKDDTGHPEHLHQSLGNCSCNPSPALAHMQANASAKVDMRPFVRSNAQIAAKVCIWHIEKSGQDIGGAALLHDVIVALIAVVPRSCHASSDFSEVIF